jgi:hypothetical protein
MSALLLLIGSYWESRLTAPGLGRVKTEEFRRLRADPT